MAEAIGERIHRYILDGSDDDLRRLLGIAEVSAEAARTRLLRTGISEGWRVIDCGCGPLGGLAVLAELVGRSGHVTGVDMNDAAIAKARSVVAALGIDNVTTSVTDVHAADPDGLGAPFDLAYARCFLMHQPEPVQTLTRISELVRPGGWIVAQEPLETPPPRSHPRCAALPRYWEVMHETMRRFGASATAVDDLPAAARAAGLEVVEVEGYCDVMRPVTGFELHAGTAAAARDRVAQADPALAAEVDALVDELKRATEAAYDWVTTPFFLHVAMRKPEGEQG